MTGFIPKKAFFTKGVGAHKEKLESFESALRDAGIEKYNLVMVSSIMPAQCKLISREEGLKLLHPGQIVYCVMAREETNKSGLIASSVGLARPVDKSHYGYISEHHSHGQTKKVVGEYTEDLAASMLASTLGIQFDVNKAWDERKQVFKLSKKIIGTKNFTATSKGKNGKWTTTVASVIFCE